MRLCRLLPLRTSPASRSARIKSEFTTAAHGSRPTYLVNSRNDTRELLVRDVRSVRKITIFNKFSLFQQKEKEEKERKSSKMKRPPTAKIAAHYPVPPLPVAHES